MKKLLSAIVAAAMFTSTFAMAMTRTEFLTATGLTDLSDVVPTVVNENVNADILLKESDSSVFQQGPIVIKKNNSEAFPEFDFRADLDMGSVRELFTSYLELAKNRIGDDNAEGMADLDATPVTGEFVVTVTYHNSIDIPEEMTDDSQSLEGFNDEVSNIFEEVSREVVDYGANQKQLIITIDVAGPVDGATGARRTLTCKDLEDNLDEYLPDLSLTCEGVSPTEYGTYDIYGSVTGKTVIGDENEPITTVNYTAVQEGTDNDSTLYGRVGVTKKTSTGSTGTTGGGSGSIMIPVTPSTGEVTVMFDINGNTVAMDPIESGSAFTLDLSQIQAPELKGMRFGGWYLDYAFSIPAPASMPITKDTILFAKYEIVKGPEVFETDTHDLYIAGYPDGTVRPGAHITREEVAQALYRLLTDDVVSAIKTTDNNFTDFDETRWSVEAVSSMAKAGYLTGYEDGSFLPAKEITRAEFATIIGRFFDTSGVDTSNTPYNDVAGHWAETNIIAARNMGFVQGYEDGTFRPDDFITRAEAITIINRVTSRHVTAGGLIEGYKTWPDIAETDWYYYDIIEATNSHSYGSRDENNNEFWSELR